MTLYLFHGQEDFLIEKDINKLKEKLLDKTFLSMNFKTFYNPSFPELMDILRTPPIMFGNSLFIIECDEYFKKSFDDKQYKQLEQTLTDVPQQVNIIFLYKISRNSKDKIDTRKKIYKILSKYCDTEEYKELPTYDKSLPAIITKLGKENGLEITTKCATKIIEQIGANLRIIDNEFKKLKLYIEPKSQPTIEDIENVCSTIKNVFHLVDYFIQNDKDKSLQELRLLIKYQHPLTIISLMQSTIDRYINLKLMSRTMGAQEISKKLFIHEYRIKLELDKINNLTYNQLLQLKKNIIDYSYKMKSDNPLSAEQLIEQLILDGVK